MNKSKLTQLYFSLSLAERDRLEAFVCSPYHNTHQGVTDLHQLFRKADNPEAESLQKSAVFDVLFPGQAFDDAKIRHLMSYFRKVIEDFLAVEALNQDPDTRERYLLKTLRKKGQHKIFEQKWKASLHRLEKQGDRNTSYYEHRFRLFEERAQTIPGRDKHLSESLVQLAANLDTWLLSLRLQNACDLISHQKVVRTTFQPGLETSLLNYVEDNQLMAIPAIGAYYHTARMLRENSEEHFRKLKRMLSDTASQLDREAAHALYLYAINFCIGQLNEGKQHYLRETFSLYQEALEKEIMLENGHLSPWTYKNIVAAGLKLREFEWTEHFLQAYRRRLDPIHQDSMYAYNLARMRFAQQDFKAVTKLLRTLETKDLFTRIDAKVMISKSFFELGEQNLLEYHLENFKQLLGRKEVLTYHRDKYLNFIRYFKKVIRLNPYDQRKKTELIRTIREQQDLMEQKWFLEKLESDGAR